MDNSTKLFIFNNYFIPVLVILFLAGSCYIYLISKLKKTTKKEVLAPLNKLIKSLKILIIFCSVSVAFLVLMFLLW